MTESRPRAAQGAIAWLRSHAAAMSDQILISATNFVTQVLPARAMDRGEFGTFSIIYSILLMANIFQSTLITQAHNVIGSTRKGRDYRRYTSSIAFGQLVVVGVEVLLILPLTLIAFISGWASAGMLLAVIPAIVFWQLQEFVRRVLYTEGRHSAALVNDIISYGGQSVVLAVCYYGHEHAGWAFNGALALYVLAATSAAGVLLGVFQLRGSIGKYFGWEDLDDNWHFGKWLLGGELLQYCSSIHMQVLWAAWLLGVTASADLRAAQILYGPTRVVAFFLGTILPIRFAKTLHEHGTKALVTQIKHVYAVLVPLVGVYCLILVFFPHTLLRLIYRDQYDQTGAVHILMLYSLCAFISYMQMAVAATLLAARQTRHIFAANVFGCGVALIASPLCIKLMGEAGSIVSMILSTIVVTVLFIVACRKYVFGRGKQTALDGEMTALENDAVAAEPQHADRNACDPSGELLMRVLGVLDRDGMQYCILHGYQDLPNRVRGDIDMLVAREAMPRRLAELLRNNQNALDADVVQWFSDGAHFIVLAGRTRNDAAPAMLQLHISCDYEVSGRIVFNGDEILRSRRQSPAGFWVPSAEIEFASVLANRLDKGEIKETHARRLSELWSESTDRCRHQLARLLPTSHAQKIEQAAVCGDWMPVTESIQSLRKEVRRELAQGQRAGLALRGLAAQLRRFIRWTHPQCGLHVVFLGPDGAGKSTVIDAVRDRIAPAFLETNYQTFARGILPTRPKKAPHALPPRSLVQSLIKAAWWLACYSPGYYARVYPTKARGGLWINHRYLLDAIVDPDRYRYGGPVKLVRWIWAIVPKPDLIIVLDAPVEVLCARKQEVEPTKLARLREGYVALAQAQPNAHVISADQPLPKTIDDVTETILSHLSRRVSRRRSLR